MTSFWQNDNNKRRRRRRNNNNIDYCSSSSRVIQLLLLRLFLLVGVLSLLLLSIFDNNNKCCHIDSPIVFVHAFSPTSTSVGRPLYIRQQQQQQQQQHVAFGQYRSFQRISINNNINHFHLGRRRRRHRPSNHVFSRSSSSVPPFRLTTTASNDDEYNNNKINIIQKAIIKFRTRPITYMLIPCIAAIVGWVTNWMAVQMIFYPIQFKGILIYVKEQVPLGFIGWQGIVPCKTLIMTNTMIDMVTTQLLTINEAFAKLQPKQVVQLLKPEIPKLAKPIIPDIFPNLSKCIPDAVTNKVLYYSSNKFLYDLTISLQQNAEQIFSIRNCVIQQMLNNRSKLGELFQNCAQAELDFLTNSGLWFGFLLGIIQMMVALFWDNPWSLSIGGLIVGYATNWLALKWIFEPVNPIKFGPFILQGKFLRRQKEVAAEFANYFSNNLLTGQQIWNSILNDPETKPAFTTIFTTHFTKFVNKVTRTFRFFIPINPDTMAKVTQKAIDKLPDHVPVLFPYMDKTLNLEETLRIRMEQMSSSKFERVLHPIFEEDELTLILAGAALGFAAGLIQQGLETGKIRIPNIWKPIRTGTSKLINRIRQRRRKNSDGGESTST